MHRKKQLSPTHEMYLKVLYRVHEEHDVARVRDLAKGLGVQPGTVSSALKRLERMRFVKHDRYGAVRLTTTGAGVAECVVRRYDVLKAVLIEVFGLDAETAEIDACMMEHAVSPATVNRMDAVLESVRSGRTKLPLPSAPGLTGEDDQCQQCEVLMACQAAAAGVEP